jgi:hypothetical protein
MAALRAFLLPLLACSLGALAGCGGSGAITCQPNVQVPCSCAGGLVGRKVCREDGRGYTACSCGPEVLPDGGPIGGDGGGRPDLVARPDLSRSDQGVDLVSPDLSQSCSTFDCQVDGDCCPGLECDPLFLVCQTPCTTADCCSNVCIQGLCVSSQCTTSGQGCSSDGSCCSGLCVSGTCCTAQGQPCTGVANECCNDLVCRPSGKCEDPNSCGTQNDPCTSDLQCCNSNCSSGICID